MNFHIKDNGDTARCFAQKGNCPVTRKSGDEHYESEEEAREAYEKSNEQSGRFLSGDSIRRVLPEYNKKKLAALAETIEDSRFDYDNGFKVGSLEFKHYDKWENEDCKEFETHAINPLNRAKVSVDRYNGRMYSYIESDTGITALEGSSFKIGENESDNEVSAKALFIAERIASEGKYDDLLKPDEEAVDNYYQLMKLKLMGDSDYNSSGDMKVPGYVESFEQTAVAAPQQYVGQLPNGNTLIIENQYGRNSAIIGRERVFSEDGKLDDSHSRMSFIAKLMKKLDERPELTVEESKNSSY